MHLYLYLPPVLRRLIIRGYYQSIFTDIRTVIIQRKQWCDEGTVQFNLYADDDLVGSFWSRGSLNTIMRRLDRVTVVYESIRTQGRLRQRAVTRHINTLTVEQGTAMEVSMLPNHPDDDLLTHMREWCLSFIADITPDKISFSLEELRDATSGIPEGWEREEAAVRAAQANVPVYDVPLTPSTNDLECCI